MLGLRLPLSRSLRRTLPIAGLHLAPVHLLDYLAGPNCDSFAHEYYVRLVSLEANSYRSIGETHCQMWLKAVATRLSAMVLFNQHQSASLKACSSSSSSFARCSWRQPYRPRTLKIDRFLLTILSPSAFKRTVLFPASTQKM